MDVTSRLVATGLSQLQAEAYLLLLEAGSVSPPNAARKLSISRTNAYKLLEKLEELGLAKKKQNNKAVSYEPNNPLALSNLVSEQRNIASKREDAVRDVLSELKGRFESTEKDARVLVRRGKHAVIEAYKEQLLEDDDVYFLRSRSDIPTLGFDVMHEIRTHPERHNNKRYGITPDSANGTNISKGDSRSALARTWVKEEDYTAPMEWSASGSSLLLVVFGAKPYAVSIQDKVVANAFKQMYLLLDNLLKQTDYYKTLPR